MSLFNYNYFPILFFLLWNILYVKPFFSKNSSDKPSLFNTLRFSKSSLYENSTVLKNQIYSLPPVDRRPTGNKNLLQPEITTNRTLIN